MIHSQTTRPKNIAHLVGKKGACPAEAGALVPVFEKLARELKLKQKLPKFKRTIQIAIFNIRISNRIGQL